MSYSGGSPRGVTASLLRTMDRNSASGAPVTTCTHQGCRLPPDGARRAWSRMVRTVASGTGVGRKARQLMRLSTASLTFTCRPPGRHAILAEMNVASSVAVDDDRTGPVQL